MYRPFSRTLSRSHTTRLGPEGVDKGGEIIATGTPEEVAENPNSYTGKYLKAVLQRYQPLSV